MVSPSFAWHPSLTSPVFCHLTAMSSYLYIVKSELPLVIQAFLKADPNSEWVCMSSTSMHCAEKHVSLTCWPQRTNTACASSGLTHCGQRVFQYPPHIDSARVGCVNKTNAWNWLSSRSAVTAGYLFIYAFTEKSPHGCQRVEARTHYESHAKDTIIFIIPGRCAFSNESFFSKGAARIWIILSSAATTVEHPFLWVPMLICLYR